MKNHQNLTIVTMAILYREGKFLMQLRDDIEGILYPGQWGFFGGHLEAGETIEEGLKRELLEEINYNCQDFNLFWREQKANFSKYVYSAPLTVTIDQLTLNEGWDFKLVTVEEINHGQIYSEKAKQIRPIGEPHQKILLDFLSKNVKF